MKKHKKHVWKLLLLILIIVITRRIVNEMYVYRYKIEFHNGTSAIDITEFTVTKVKPDKLKMRNFKVKVDLTITPRIEREHKLRTIQLSERFEEINGETVAVIEFTPDVEYTFEKITAPQVIKHSFDYKLNVYQSGINKYVFRCGDKEQHIQVQVE